MTWATVGAFLLKWLWQIIVGLLVIAILWYAAYRFFGDGPRHDAAVATATSAINAAGTNSAHDAIETVNGNAAHVTTVHDTTRIEHETIIKTPGAGLELSPELDAAGRSGVCMLDPRTCHTDGK